MWINNVLECASKRVSTHRLRRLVQRVSEEGVTLQSVSCFVRVASGTSLAAALPRTAASLSPPSRMELAVETASECLGMSDDVLAAADADSASFRSARQQGLASSQVVEFLHSNLALSSGRGFDDASRGLPSDDRGVSMPQPSRNAAAAFAAMVSAEFAELTESLPQTRVRLMQSCQRARGAGLHPAYGLACESREQRNRLARDLIAERRAARLGRPITSSIVARLATVRTGAEVRSAFERVSELDR